MKRLKIDPQLVEPLVGMLALALMVTGILVYALSEPQRIERAQAAILSNNLDEAMTLYAQNCSICHGLAGEGIGATPALNRPDLSQVDSETLNKVISRGLYGTSMPAWSVEDGGPLSDYEIETMVLLMQKGDWEQTRDRVVNLGLAPLVPFTSEPEQAFLEQVAALPEGDVLAQGVTIYAQQCVACHGADGMGTSLAPALNDPLVSGKEASEIERVIRNGVAGTLMAGWQNALADDEITALLTLITDWDQVPSGAIPAPDQPVPVTQESLQLGADLYAQSCARCHGAEGQGTPRAPSLNVKSYLVETSDAALQQIITLGVPATAMPAWGDRLSDSEIQAVVGFLRSWEATAPEVATPARGGGPWWAVEGGTRPRKNAMPSGGVQPAAVEQPGSGIGTGEQVVQPTEAATGEGQAQTGAAGQDAEALVAQATSPGAGQAAGDQHGVEQGGGINVDHAQGAGDQPGTGNPPWANQVETSWWQALDWQAAVLLGTVLITAVALIGIALFGLVRVRS